MPSDRRTQVNNSLTFSGPSFFQTKTRPVQSEGGSFVRTMRIGQPAATAPGGTK
ncbi:hypothetical protein GsuE55_24110 [Geobacillus subterraneus]|uniref:Uncharacterized protein n=1 Tax=Geobacillus subterraneus TaxID=129338 RepID=A0A679FMG3_9BACL|nr:hypothetical protein GsuE55_24110 [Geobacillus subterraneus]